MIAQLRAELLKLRSTRTTIGLGLGMVALVLLIVLISGLTGSSSDVVDAGRQRGTFGIGGAALLFSSLVGVLTVTGEFRYGTIRPTLLFSPSRSRLVAAKLAASLIAGVTFGVIAEGLAFGVGYAVLAGRGGSIVLGTNELLLLTLGSVANATLWAGVGVGVGAILRNQIGATVGLLAWIFIAENLIFGFVPSVGRYLPGPSGQALAGDKTDHLVTPLAGGLLLVAYVLALAAAGAELTTRRDVD